MRILVTDGMDQSAVAKLKANGHEVIEQFFAPEKLGGVLKTVDVAVIRSRTKICANHIDEAKNGRLKLIIRGGVGVDNIDVRYAEECGIAVKNTPLSSSNSVAETAMAHIFSCAHYISISGHTMREGKWEKKTYNKGFEVRGKTLGIIGFGRIGQSLCCIAKGVGMDVIAYSRTRREEYENRLGMRFVDLDELFSNADVISLHIPAVDGMPIIRKETIEKMKDGVVIINTSRGSNIDEEALLAALNSGKIRAAGLDVYADEPTLNSALCRHQNVSCTPHLGAATEEAQQRIGNEIVEMITGFSNQSDVPDKM